MDTSRRAFRTGLALALVVVAYFTMPVEQGRALVPRAIAGVAALVALAIVISRQLRRRDDRVGHLVMLLVLVVVAFATSFYALATLRPDEFTGLNTRVDALYFTVVTMTTIGYGDIHPVGQLARSMVLLVIGFDVIFIGALGSAIAERARRRRQ